jgi:CHAD domain-containing protein
MTHPALKKSYALVDIPLHVVRFRLNFVTIRVSPMNMSAGLAGLYRKRVRALAREVEHIHAGDVDALHRIRVASRRLRELLPLVRFDRDTGRKLRRRVRKATRHLGSVRELDVLAALIQELRGHARYSASALKQVGAAVADSRATAREQLAAKLSTSKMERLIRRLEEAGSHLESDEKARKGRRPTESGHAWIWALDAREVQRASTLQSSIENAGGLYVSERLHRVRLAVKKLRYAAELRAAAPGGPPKADLRALRAAQDLLGHLHDVEVLIGYVRHVQSTMSAPDLTAWHQLGLLMRVLEDDCRRLHGRYMRDRAKLLSIAARMAGTKGQAGSKSGWSPAPRNASGSPIV